MTEVIHEHSSDSSNGLYILLAIVIVALLGFFLWRYLPNNDRTDDNDLNVNVDFPGGSNSGSGSGSGSTTY